MKKFKFFVDGIKFQTEKQFLTGLEIKMMANVPEDLDLYLVVHGYQDELISNDKTVNLSRPGVEKFETRKKHEGLLLIINTRPVAFDGKKISYEEVVSLAGYDFSKPDRGYTVTYENGPKQNPEGGLLKGQNVFVKHLMQFHVNATDKS